MDYLSHREGLTGHGCKGTVNRWHVDISSNRWHVGAKRRRGHVEEVLTQVIAFERGGCGGESLKSESFAT